MVFDAFGNRVFEDARFGIHFVPRHLQHVGEKAFRQPIAPNDADGNFEAFARQADVAAHFVLHVAVVDELS